MMTTDALGLYLHVPFCLKKCGYCDFFSTPCYTPDLLDAYVEALCKEIRARAEKGREVDTVYFGGGTPTVLSETHFSQILETLRSAFSIASDGEITVEMNPATADLAKLRHLRSLGVNRISMGAQAMDDRHLRTLGRVHTADQLLSSFAAAREAGFSNISVDLMYNIPGQTAEEFLSTVDRVLALEPAHVSAYSLILEEGTPFYSRYTSSDLLGQDEEYGMYRALCLRMAEAGFRHYEISNYAKAGQESRHNLRYWTLRPYLGFGPSAHSYDEGARTYRDADLSAYIRDPLAPPEVERGESASEAAYEYAMLGLRTADGISLSRYETLADRSLLEGKEGLLSRLTAEGQMMLAGDRLCLTEQGMYVSSAILCALL